MFREISFQVSSSGITPYTVQHAGVQGEQNATRLSFTIDGNLQSKLTEAAKGATLYYRFDTYDSLGCSNSTEPKVLGEGQQVYYDIGLELSAVGGNAKVYLVITSITEDKTEAELISFPALINFTKKVGAEYEQLQKESLSALYTGVVKNAEAAKTSEKISTENAKAAESAREQVEENTQMVMRVIGEFPEIDEKLDNAQELLTQCEGATKELKTIKEELAEGGYITGIKESNHGHILGFWVGTQAEYDALPEPPQNSYVIISDDKTLETLMNKINAIEPVYGTYAPVFLDAGGQATGAEYEYQTGAFCKIGKLVYFNISIKGKVTSVSNTNYASVSLPNEFVGEPVHTTTPVTVGECFNLVDDDTVHHAIIGATNNIAHICLQGGLGQYAVPWKLDSIGWVKLSGLYMVK